ncbi:helix-turn-helix transcriptional regulator [Erythrobacter sp. sf7]|uniref:Helix-turn-helix transcriptional regulator n=1 Tax=Erythrobacter fulvus TaxID=2987523 RepID=A0ABT5JRS4_9SPHN|nr:helix-turn-helix transcriptional regulator [Erythrobacter fulvus]MDC8755358.1 helix-turn-helix transcriptional regulator [Erythrobacter fulvus]
MDESGSRLSETKAARMLAAGLRRVSEERGLSLRQLAKILNYKQAVVLSHMSLGRVPIPIDRAEELAEVLGLDKASFLRAVVEQRHPEVDWALLGTSVEPEPQSSGLAEELQAIIGGSLQELTSGQRRVLREVAHDGRAERRWATVQELPTLELIRQWRPSFREAGLPETDRRALKAMLAGSHDPQT